MVFFNRIEIYAFEGAWCRPDEWTFYKDYSCANGCHILCFFWLRLSFNLKRKPCAHYTESQTVI